MVSKLNAQNRSIIHALRFRARGKLVRSGSFEISKGLYTYLKALGVGGRWTNGSDLFADNNIDTARFYDDGFSVSIRPSSLKIKVRRASPIRFFDHKLQAQTTVALFYFDFKFHHCENIP